MKEEMKNLKKKQEEYLEEFAELHNQDCFCLMEEPDACNCDNMKQIKHIMDKVRKETAEAGKQRILDIIDEVQTKEEENRFGTNLDWDDGFITAINIILKKIIRIKEEKEIKK